ncbi:MAG: M48 family metallopeptidase [Sterolibacterium sp.]|nr:M48 family metallopeptidase [Sterolibacterium sp.]
MSTTRPHYGLRHSLPLLLCIAITTAHADGIQFDKPSALRQLVPAASLERQAASEYDELKRQAASKQALAPADHPQTRRLRAIAARMIPLATRYNPGAKQWRWEVNLIGSKQVNAFCMPGGKIAFFSGLLEGLRLTDDETAIVMGHEIAHALREHARERMAKSELTSLGASLLGQFVAQGKYADAFRLGGNLLTLKFSREDESDADLVGLDLAARAGFDPRAGITLWQKMTTANRGAPPQWLSTHPSGPNRIREIEQHLPQVMPLYERTARSSPSQPTR